MTKRTRMDQSRIDNTAPPASSGASMEDDMPSNFRPFLVSRDENKKQSVNVVEMRDEELMEGDVLVKVEHTTVNYKDGLAITGKAPVVRRWPMIPGIDLAGTVISSDSGEWKAGDKVVLNGWGVGEVGTALTRATPA